MPAAPRVSRVPPVRRLASDITRSWIAVAIGFPFIIAVPFVGLFFPEVLPLEALEDPRALYAGSFYVAWTVFCLANIVLTNAAFHRLSGPELRRQLDATAGPEGGLRRFWWGLNGGGAIDWAGTGSVVALFALLDLAISGRDLPLLFVIAGIAVVPASLAVIVTTFAVSHARADRDGALRFPGTESPVFADYLYLSIQLTTTFGASDVEVTSTRLRRAVSIHSLLAFAYNAFVIALLVSALLNAVPS